MNKRALIMLVATALVVAGCGGADDASDEGASNPDPPIETTEDDTTVPDVTTAETVEIVDESDSEMVDDDELSAEDLNAEVSLLTDEELAAELSGLTDEDLEVFLQLLDEDNAARVAAALGLTDVEGDSAGGTGEASSAGSGFDAETEAILAELVEGGFCDPDDVSAGGEGSEVTSMHFVVDSTVQPPCSGELDPRVEAAWATLTEVTPTSLTDRVTLLAGFNGCEECTTAAFVSALDEGGSIFLMAIDVQFGEQDPDELALTLQHELSHVFTQDPETQLDVSVGPDECTTYYNGNGCFRDDSYGWEWIQQFWDAESLATIVADDANGEAGVDRCTAGAPFTGSYGAGDPEEDLAQVYSAFVYDVDVSPALADKLAFFDAYPEFREVRERAEAAGRHEGNYSFENC